MRPYPIPPPPEPYPFTDPLPAAVIDLIFERGYEAVTERLIVDRAGTTLGEFHRRFADKQEATVKTFEVCQQDFEWTVGTAYATGSDWRGGLRAAAWTVADYMEEHPRLIHACVIGLLRAKNEMLRVVRENILLYGATVIDRGRAEVPEASSVPLGAALMAEGSIAQLLTQRLQRSEPVAPHEMVPQMLYLAVRPYVGEEAAREELHAPRPRGSFVRRSGMAG
jgi:AcrR family transcriptional regulator